MATSEDIFNELRVASKGGTADYFGITYEKIEKNMGVFWPCPSLDHPGTPRLWEDRKFKTPDGKAHFNAVSYRGSPAWAYTGMALFALLCLAVNGHFYHRRASPTHC